MRIRKRRWRDHEKTRGDFDGCRVIGPTETTTMKAVLIQVRRKPLPLLVFPFSFFFLRVSVPPCFFCCFCPASRRPSRHCRSLRASRPNRYGPTPSAWCRMLALVGSPLTKLQRQQFEAALNEADDEQCVAKIQAALDPLCLALVSINPESRVKVAPGAAAAELVQHGWRVFLVKVHNEAGVTAPLRVTSPQCRASRCEEEIDRQTRTEAFDLAAASVGSLAGREPVRRPAAEQAAFGPGG